MSALDLLVGFSRRGIQLKGEGERLIYDAPQGVMKAADLEQLPKHKSELLMYLNREAANTVAAPAHVLSAGTPSIGSYQASWHCRACEPDMPLSATTLTLLCHKVELRLVPTHAGLCTLFENACQGLSLTPEQLRWELEENGDIANLVSGALRPAL
jgi:hypothetical protein